MPPAERDDSNPASVPSVSAELERLRPRRPWWRGALTLLTGLAVVLTLAVSWRATQIDPGGLWSKRWNAVEYLFGRAITQEQRDEARRQAERMPRLMVTEEARQLVRDELARAPSPGRAPDAREFDRLVSRRADELADAMPEAERGALVEREYARSIQKLRGGYFPPETDPAKLRQYGEALLETLAIALWGTVLAVLAAIPLGLLAARSTLAIIAPGEHRRHHAIRWVARFIVRRFLDACRGFNEYVLALIIVVIIGLGPFTGVLALFIHSAGVLGKVFSEVIEAIDQGQVEGVTSTGATPAQIVSYAVMPQIMPHLVSNSLLRFETNVRSAAILGVVGAGGIGFLMTDKINSYQNREVCTMLIIVIITVTLIDFACGRLMRRFL